jgi:single-stranded DNA-binding protein
MNDSINLVVMGGHIVSDPTFGCTGTGAPVCNFVLETTDEWRDSRGADHRRTDSHNVAVFGRADSERPHRRGDYVIIRGRLRYQAGIGLPEIVAAVCVTPRGTP